VKLRGSGVPTIRAHRGAIYAVSAALLFAGGSGSVAAASSEETARYRFEAFVPGADDPRLPPELRARHSSARSTELLPADRSVEISWVSREGPGLREYRLTATIDGGSLSGIAARWTVAPATAEADGPPGPRLYRVRLPLPVDGRLRLHAALEAVREDGTAVLLAVRHATPARTAGDRFIAVPGWRGAGPSAPARSVLPPPTTSFLVSERDTGLPDLRSEPRSLDGCALSSLDAVSPGRPRGPPSSRS